MPKRSTLTYCAALIPLLAWCDLAPAAAPPAMKQVAPALSDPIVHLTKSRAAVFPDALAALAAQSHVAIVAEGAPLKPRLTDDAVPDLTADAPLSKTIAKLAAAYDYDAQRQDSGVFVLTKRYTDPRDLPCVTLDECRAVLTDVIQVLDTFSPHFAESIRIDGQHGELDTVIHFFGSLSPDQMQAARAKTLRYGDLDPGQQAQIKNFVLYQFAQMPLDQVQQSLRMLDEASNSVLTARDAKGNDGVFVELPSINVPQTMLVPLVQGPPDQLLLSMPPPAPPPGPPPAPPTTLAAAVAGLKPIDGRQPVVDKSVAGKPVTAAGLDHAAPMDVLRALAVLYGLRDGATDTGAPELERPPAEIPTSLREVGPDAWAAMPASFLRALHVPTGNFSPATAPMGMQEYRAINFSHFISDFMQKEAARRVLRSMQPQLRQKGAGARVAVSSLDEGTRGALAVALMTEGLWSLNELSSFPKERVMDCLDDMDQMVIYTVPGEEAQRQGQVVPSLYLEGTDPYTKEEIGLGGIRYFTPPPIKTGTSVTQTQ